MIGSLAVMLLAGQVAAVDPAPSPRSVGGVALGAVAGVPTLPFDEYEAEDLAGTGHVIGPDRRFGTVAAEASGRRAVVLEGSDAYVEVVLAGPADALMVRASVPDAPGCHDGDAALSVSVEGQVVGRLELTPCFGWFYGDYPFTNRAEDGGGHHAFDHARLRLDRTLPAGTRVRLSPATGTIPITLDLIDAVMVGAADAPPADALSVLDFGADPTGRAESRAAIQTALDRGRRDRRPVWMPEGWYRVDGHLTVDQVALLGAGPWRTTLTGDGVGIVGRGADGGAAEDVRLSGFAIIGQVMDRDDEAQLNGLGGGFSDSVIEDLFIQHTKVGAWLDGPMHDTVLRRLVIVDQTADGVNFHGGVERSVVEDSLIRNTGDDGLAMWSRPTPNVGDVFRRNVVVAPLLANGIAIYGGRDNRAEGNLVADTLTRGGGLHAGARFGATPFEGRTVLEGNVLARTGSMDPVWRHGVGAVWLYALDRPMTGARFDFCGTTVIDSTAEAFQVMGQRIEGLTIDGAEVRGGPLLDIRAEGQAEVGGVTVDGRPAATPAGTDAFRITAPAAPAC